MDNLATNLLIGGICSITGILIGMIFGHYITLKATTALTDLETTVKSEFTSIHAKLLGMKNAVEIPVKKVETAIIDAVDVIETDLHKDEATITTDVTNTEKQVTNDIQTIGNKIKLI